METIATLETMEFSVVSVDDLRATAYAIYERVSGRGRGRSDGALVLALTGDLGAGKTAFTKALAASLGITENVTSPTFVILKIYPIPQGLFTNLMHIDAYRLESGEELSRLGFEQLLKDQKNLIIIEWPERVADRVPETAVWVRFTITGETTRELSVDINED